MTTNSRSSGSTNANVPDAKTAAKSTAPGANSAGAKAAASLKDMPELDTGSKLATRQKNAEIFKKKKGEDDVVSGSDRPHDNVASDWGDAAASGNASGDAPILLAQADTAAAGAASGSGAATSAGVAAGAETGAAAAGAEAAGAAATSAATAGTVAAGAAAAGISTAGMVALGAVAVGAAAGGGSGGSGGSGASPGTPQTPAADTTAPTLQSVSISAAGNNKIVLTYSEALDATNAPAAGAFSVTTGGAANAVTAVQVSGSTVTLTLTSPVAAGQVVSVTYTDPTAGNDALAIQDAAGNDAITATGGFTMAAVADGYVRGAQIYIDTNGNGVADASEAISGVVTNANGGFVLPAGAPAGAIIAVGGVNIDTGVPNTMVLKAPAGSSVVTPLTTLIQEIVKSNTGMTAAQAEADILTTLGLALPAGQTLTSYDPIASNDVAVQAAAVQVATIVALAVESATTDSSTTTTAAAATNAVMTGLASAITAAAAGSGSVDLTDNATITAAVTGAVDAANLAAVAGAVSTATAAIDAATTLSGVSTAQAVAVDRTAPTAPTAVSLAAASDTGTTGDNKTNDSTPVVRVTFDATAIDGTAAVQGDTITLYEGAVAVGTATLNAANVSAGYVDVTLTTALVGDGAHALTAKVTDVAGHASAASTAYSLTLDATAPAAPTLAEQGSTDVTGSGTQYMNAAEAATTTFRVGLAGTGATAPVAGDSVELLLGGASFATPKTAVLSAANITNGYVDFTVVAADLGSDGAKSLTAKIADTAGNLGTASAALDFTLDTAIATPTITLATNSGNASDSISSDASLTFSAAAADVTRTYTIGSGSASGSYTAPTIDGTYTVTVNDVDTAGNTATASTTFTLDTTGPTLSSTTPADGAAAVVGNSIVLTFNENVVAGTGNIVVADTTHSQTVNIPVGDAQVVFSGNTVTITPTVAPLPATAYTITIGAGVITDVAGNAYAGNTGNALDFTMADLPTVAIQIVEADSLLNVGDTAVVNFTLSAASTDFVVGDVTVAGGTLSNFTGSGTSYSAILTPDAGRTTPINVSVDQGKFTYNTLPNLASSTVSINADTAAPVAPTLALHTNSGSTSDSITNVGTVDVSGIEAGATWQYSTNNGSSWTTGTGTSFTLAGDGSKSVIVRQTDVSGNASANSSAFAFTLDTTIATPTVALTTNSGSTSDSITNSAALTLSSAASDVTRTYTVDSGSATGTYTAPTAGGSHTVLVTDTDTAGNTASASVTFTLDTTAPTVVSTVPTPSATGVTPTANLSITFSENVVAGTGNITLTDVTHGGSITVAVTDAQVTFSGHTMTVNPTSDLLPGTVYQASVPVGAVTDEAGNAVSYTGATMDLGFTTASVPTIQNAAALTATAGTGATRLDVRSDLVLDFSDTIALGTGQIRIMDDMGANGWTVTNTTSLETKQDVTDNDVVITLTNGSVTGLTIGGVDKSSEMAGSVTVSGDKLIISPAGADSASATDWDFDWDFGANYHVELDAGVVTANGLGNAAVTSTTALAFTTVTPLGNAAGAASVTMASDGTMAASYTWHHGHVDDATGTGTAMSFATGSHALMLVSGTGGDNRNTTVGGKVLLSGFSSDDVIYMDNMGNMSMPTTDGVGVGAGYTGSGNSMMRTLANSDGGSQLQTVFADYSSTGYTSVTILGGGDGMLENSSHFNANLVIFG